MKEPKTLQQAIQCFTDPDNCLKCMIEHRWPDGVVVCPTCGNRDVRFLKTRRLWECRSQHPRRQFSIRVGTMMEDSAVGLDKWLVAMWMASNCKNGVSSWEIHRTIGVTQKTAWFMLHRIRLSMKREDDGTSWDRTIVEKFKLTKRRRPEPKEHAQRTQAALQPAAHRRRTRKDYRARDS